MADECCRISYESQTIIGQLYREVEEPKPPVLSDIFELQVITPPVPCCMPAGHSCVADQRSISITNNPMLRQPLWDVQTMCCVLPCMPCHRV